MNNAWYAAEGALSYDNDIFCLRAQQGRGWVDVRVGGEAFLQAPGTGAAMAYRRDDIWINAFADALQCAGDTHRQAEVLDGIFVQRIHCGDRPGEFDLYAGFNDTRDHDLVLFLAPGVVCVRVGDPADYLAARPVFDPGDPAAARAHGDSACLLHENGAWLEVVGALRCEQLALPDGATWPAVVLPCTGFTGHVFRVVCGTTERSGQWLASPKLSVATDRAKPEHGVDAGMQVPLFDRDEPVRLSVSFSPLGGAMPQTRREIEVVHMTGERLTAHGEAGPGTAVHHDAHPELPGPLEAYGRIIDQQGRLAWSGRFRLLYDIEGYEPEDSRQPDHEAFWKQTLAEMRALPLNLREEERFHRGPWTLVELSFDTLAARRVHGMLFLPRDTPRPVPVVLSAHPNIRGWGIDKAAGAYGSNVRRDVRFAWFIPLIRGHRPDAQDVPFNHPWWGPMDARESYEGRTWYATMARSLDVLAALDEGLDTTRVIAKGGSQGGALALVTAALDPRVCMCLADCPSHGQLQNTLRGYPLLRSRRGRIPPHMSAQSFADFLSYFDMANFCHLITCPTTIGHNVGDTTVHIDGGLTAWKRLTSVPPDRKRFLLGHEREHANPPASQAAMQAWMDRVAAASPHPWRD